MLHCNIRPVIVLDVAYYTVVVGCGLFLVCVKVTSSDALSERVLVSLKYSCLAFISTLLIIISKTFFLCTF